MSEIEEIAQRLGMKQSEITDVVPVADGEAVQTHDGQWTLIRNNGELEFIGELANGGIVKGKPVLVGESDPEEVVVPEGGSVKPAPKRRSNR